MTVKMYAIVLVMAVALSAGPAPAQPGAYRFAQFDKANLMSQGTPLGPFTQASAAAANAARVGDGSDPSYRQDQWRVRHGPGYSVGTG
jgi:hypothetical protein